MHFNPQQLAVIEAVRGAVCVDACAGTGKTATIIERYARLIEQGVNPDRLLLVTFTNKAAGEMSERIQQRTGRRLIWSTNFHKLCTRLIRLHPEFGVGGKFTILDTDDQSALLRRLAKANEAPTDAKWLKKVLAQVERSRLAELGYLDGAPAMTMDSMRDNLIPRLAGEYEEALRQENKLDFDLIVYTVIWGFRRVPGLAARVASRWDYVTIDEAQDTDKGQFELITYLAPHGNICLVGDMDQSIYAFRRAEYENLMRFVERFKARRLPLEINYRSMAEILDVANHAIAENTNRFQKSMRATRGHGGTVVAIRAKDQEIEARSIASIIRGAMKAGEKPGDIAVLYRASNISRLIEQALTRAVIPYKIVGGLRFWERAEVRDTIAYAKVLLGVQDPDAWRRATSNPPIGIGDKSWQAALGSGTSIEQALYASAKPKGMEWLSALKRARNLGATPHALSEFMTEVGYFTNLLRDANGLDRTTNVQEALTAMEDFGDLEEFLDEAVLGLPSRDEVQDDVVTLSTIHASKGLEWSRVFLAGCCEGTLPHVWSVTAKEVEEERRLFYVAVTRAKHNLTITSPALVTQFNQGVVPADESRFLKGLQITRINA